MPLADERVRCAAHLQSFFSPPLFDWIEPAIRPGSSTPPRTRDSKRSLCAIRVQLHRPGHADRGLHPGSHAPQSFAARHSPRRAPTFQPPPIFLTGEVSLLPSLSPRWFSFDLANSYYEPGRQVELKKRL